MIKKLTKRDIPKVKKVFEFDENLEIYFKEIDNKIVGLIIIYDNKVGYIEIIDRYEYLKNELLEFSRKIRALE